MSFIMDDHLGALHFWKGIENEICASDLGFRYWIQSERR